jgi:excisionase family DNA binding protein
MPRRSPRNDPRDPASYGPILDTAQVAALLNLNPQTVQLMAKDGRLPASRLPGTRKYHFLLDDVIEVLKQHPAAEPPAKRTPTKKTAARRRS